MEKQRSFRLDINKQSNLHSLIGFLFVMLIAFVVVYVNRSTKEAGYCYGENGEVWETDDLTNCFK